MTNSIQQALETAIEVAVESAPTTPVGVPPAVQAMAGSKLGRTLMQRDKALEHLHHDLHRVNEELIAIPLRFDASILGPDPSPAQLESLYVEDNVHSIYQMRFKRLMERQQAIQNQIDQTASYYADKLRHLRTH